MSLPNGVMMQFFHWYAPGNGVLWNELATKSADLVRDGFTSIWLPPASKGAGGRDDVGYGVYDLFDLGEFDQKKTVPTKYGTRAQLVKAIKTAQKAGLQVYADVVFNHKDSGDTTEEVWVQEVDKEHRNTVLSGWYPIHAYTQFTFDGRKDTYSSFKWHWWCFDALTYNADTKNGDKLYRLKEKQFSTEVSHEHENFEYLMANDIDMGVDFVRGELLYWGEWFLKQTSVDGFRIDACKHIRFSWFPIWLAQLRGKFGKELFSVGEYWSGDVKELHRYLFNTGGVMSLFDVPLHYKFHEASNSGNRFDMRRILDGTLMKEQPNKAVTFVENHDTQPCQSLESPVEPWFKPHAYALILLRREGYPCVFYADYYGASYTNCPNTKPDVILYSHRFLIDRFLKARREYGFGDQYDYFDHPNTIGWVRTGDATHPGAMAVVMTNGDTGNKWMNTFKPNATFTDVTGHLGEKVVTDGNGWGNFRCPAGKVSVWTQD